MKDFSSPLRGNSNVAPGHAPLDNVDRVHEEMPIGILIGFQRGLMHQASDCEVGHPARP